MNTNCQRCGNMFKRSTRNNKICLACAKKSQAERPKNHKGNIKTRKIISVNDAKGRFAGFISAPTEKELHFIKIPRGYKIYGDLV